MIGIAFSALGNLADRGIAEKKLECIARVKVAAFWRLRKCRASMRWRRSWLTAAQIARRGGCEMTLLRMELIWDELAGGPATVGELARAAAVTPKTMRSTLDYME